MLGISISVGAGSAGAVVANRLSKNNKVLLLEAGGNPVYHSSVPFMCYEMMHLPQFSWNHRTVPQSKSSQSIVDKSSLWPRGKVLGGSSTLNYMIYVRGSPLDYDEWANITGDPAWKYENVLPYFKKSLDYHGAFSDNSMSAVFNMFLASVCTSIGLQNEFKGLILLTEQHYGETPYGYLHVEKLSYGPMIEQFTKAGKELGFKAADLNGPQVVGNCT